MINLVYLVILLVILVFSYAKSQIKLDEYKQFRKEWLLTWRKEALEKRDKALMMWYIYTIIFALSGGCICAICFIIIENI